MNMYIQTPDIVTTMTHCNPPHIHHVKHESKRQIIISNEEIGDHQEKKLKKRQFMRVSLISIHLQAFDHIRTTGIIELYKKQKNNKIYYENRSIRANLT